MTFHKNLFINNSDQERYLKNKIENHQKLGMPVPAHLQLQYDKTIKHNTRLFFLLLAGGMSILALLSWMAPRS